MDLIQVLFCSASNLDHSPERKCCVFGVFFFLIDIKQLPEKCLGERENEAGSYQEGKRHFLKTITNLGIIIFQIKINVLICK